VNYTISIKEATKLRIARGDLPNYKTKGGKLLWMELGKSVFSITPEKILVDAHGKFWGFLNSARVKARIIKI